MKTIRILALMLALLLLAVPLVACDDTSEPTDGPDDETVEDIELSVVKKDETKYVLVIDYMAGPLTRANVLVLQQCFKDYLGCEIELRECFSDREDPDELDPIEREILIGMTNRPESGEFIETLKVKDYAMKIEGEKILIAGGSDESTAAAINAFNIGFVQDQGNRFEVPKGAVFSLSVKESALAEKFITSKYSYDTATMGDARIDSYLITIPAEGLMTEEYRAFAEQYREYVYVQAGYSLDLKRDAQVVKADYKVLIGDTTFTDASIVNSIEDDEYYIAFNGTEGSGTLTIIFGRDAADAAWNAYKEVMPSSATPLDFHLSDSFVKTNME